MYIYKSLIDLILAQAKVEYGGTYAPHDATPLYGRRAYWRLYLPDGTYVAKITAPVKTLNPRPETLRKLLKAELLERFRDIQLVCETDHYGQVYTKEIDPSGVKPLLQLIEKKYTDLLAKKIRVNEYLITA